MSKRQRLNSTDSLPELEDLQTPDSDDDVDLSIKREHRREIQESPPSSLDSESDGDEPVDVYHSLLNEGHSSRVEPFNLKAEMREGIVDADGNMIEGKPVASEDRDAWLESLEVQGSDDNDLSKARENVRIRDEFWTSIEKGGTGPEKSVEFYLFSLINKLQPGETPRKAMDRFLGLTSEKSDKPAFKSTIKAKRLPKPVPSQSLDVQKDTKSFEEITEVCDSIVAKGLHTVLEETRERLIELLKLRKFEYRWMNQSDGQVHGPYSFDQLMLWERQGSFTTNPIEVRYADSTQIWRTLDYFI